LLNSETQPGNVSYIGRHTGDGRTIVKGGHQLDTRNMGRYVDADGSSGDLMPYPTNAESPNAITARPQSVSPIISPSAPEVKRPLLQSMFNKGNDVADMALVGRHRDTGQPFIKTGYQIDNQRILTEFDVMDGRRTPSSAPLDDQVSGSRLSARQDIGIISPSAPEVKRPYIRTDELRRYPDINGRSSLGNLTMSNFPGGNAIPATPSISIVDQAKSKVKRPLLHRLFGSPEERALRDIQGQVGTEQFQRSLDDALGGKNKRGQDLIIYVKNMSNGSSVFVEEVRTGKQTLSAVTLYKHQTGVNSDNFRAIIAPNVLSDTGSNVSIIKNSINDIKRFYGN